MHTSKSWRDESGFVPGRLMSIRELAEYLGVSQRTAWALVAKGEIAKVQIGRAVRIPRESAEAFVARGGTRL